jgi:hypothetical protein
VDEAWERFMAAVKDAQREMGAGRPEPFKALWAHTDDVVIMGAFGSYERGWGAGQCAPRLGVERPRR